MNDWIYFYNTQLYKNYYKGKGKGDMIDMYSKVNIKIENT